VDELNEDEQAMTGLVREFVDRDVRPVVRDLEHSNTYPAEVIGQMKQLGIFGLAIGEPWAAPRSACPATCRSHRSWPAAG
jgi:alkylation response protein AidB-like acyl-CoA dehydrogenase